MLNDILIAHPGKHHVLHLVAGCVKAGLNVCYITPLYKKGIGSLLSFIPGNIGRKASGYYHSDIPLDKVMSSNYMQIKKIISFLSKSNFSIDFDQFVAKKIASGEIKAKIIVTLQDYMPKTVKVAKDNGIMIWSDQISNQSADAISRINRHQSNEKQTALLEHNENNNTSILLESDVVTVPSMYCLDGIRDVIKKSTKIFNVPYGVGLIENNLNITPDDREIIILARANSIRKGGHLLIDAIDFSFDKILNIIGDKQLTLVFLGDLDDCISTKIKKMNNFNKINIQYGNVPHSIVSGLYNRASIFVMPALSEGRSLACLEAMSAGLPVIISKFCGIDDFHSINMGIEVDDDVVSLSNALVKMFEMKDEWPFLGCNAKSFSQDYSWDKYEKSIGYIAREIIQNCGC